MKKWLTFTLLALTPGMLLAAGAEQSEGGLAGLWTLDMAFKTANFLALLILLHIYAKKPLLNAFRSSATATRDEMELTQKDVDNKEAQLAEITAKIDRMTQELEQRKAESLATIKEERAKIIADAEAQASRIGKAMEKRIAQNLARAKHELREFLATEAAEQAEADLKEKIGTKQKQALINEYTQTLTQVG